jgi:hypothetical protein
MRFACPHCQKSGITLFAKAFSAPSQPAKCLECGALSFQIGLGKHTALHTLAPYAVPIIALILASWWPVVVYLLLCLALWLVPTFWQPMTPTTETQVRGIRRNGWIGAAAFVLLLTAVGIFQWWK